MPNPPDHWEEPNFRVQDGENCHRLPFKILRLRDAHDKCAFALATRARLRASQIRQCGPGPIGIENIGSLTMATNQPPRFVEPVQDGHHRTWSPTPGENYGWALATLSDGSLVIVGDGPGSGGWDFAALKVRADGSPDPTFGSAGVRLLSFGSAEDHAYTVASMADGRLVLAGNSGPSQGNADFAVARLLANGQLDGAFGKGGTVSIDFARGYDSAYAAVTLSDGSIVLGGESSNGSNADFAFARLRVDGSPDPAFGVGGKVVVTVGVGDDRVNAMTVLADGAIVAVGESWANGAPQLAVVRLRSDGSLDPAFGSGGKVIAPSGTSTTGMSVAVQADGRLVIAGTIDDGTDSNFLIVRLTANGQLDPTFGANGVVSVGPNDGNDHGWGVAIQADGKIVVAGDSARGLDTDFSAVRLNANGSLDSTFSGDGKVLIAVGASNDHGSALSVLPDGRIVIAGDAVTTVGRDLAAVRLGPDGTVDPTFGAIDTLAGSSTTYVQRGNAVVLDSDVALVDAELAASGNYAGASVTLARSGGAVDEDRFSAAPGSPLSLSDGKVLVSGVTVGTYSTGGGSLSILFNTTATQDRVNLALRNLAYANSAESPPASVNVQWTASDGNAGAQGTGGPSTVVATTVVKITASTDPRTNLPPTVAAPIGEQSWVEGTLTQFVVPIKTFSDPEGKSLILHATQLDGSPLPSWLSFSPASHLFAGSTPTGAPDIAVRLSATDPGGLSVTTDFLIRTRAANEGVVINGTTLSDKLVGSTQADQLFGGKGNDELTGGGGNDAIDGGEGADTAIYIGAFSEYQVIQDAATGNYVITDGIAGRDGVDTLTSVEYARFSDGTRALGDAPPPADPGSAINGTDGPDSLTGGPHDDTISGKAGDDIINGNDGNDVLYGGKGADVFDLDPQMRGGADQLVGNEGNDTYYLDDPGDQVIEQPVQGTDTIWVPFSYWLTKLPNVENVRAYGPGPVQIVGNDLANLLTGSDGDDLFTGGRGNDRIEGGAGLDTAIFSGQHGGYTIKRDGLSISIQARIGSDGLDTLIDIERLQFIDVDVALDLDGNAGTVARLLGAVFGRESVDNRLYAGIGLDYADKGMGAVELAAFAMSAAGRSDPRAIVELLWHNVVGTDPTTEDIQVYVDMVTSGDKSVGELSWFAATTGLNETNIDLVGLAASGLAYTPAS
jgi:uncharacterized delta-60 repeat protein